MDRCPFNADAAQGVDSGVACGLAASKVGGERRREIKVLRTRPRSMADLRPSWGFVSDADEGNDEDEEAEKEEEEEIGSDPNAVIISIHS